MLQASSVKPILYVHLPTPYPIDFFTILGMKGGLTGYQMEIYFQVW